MHGSCVLGPRKYAVDPWLWGGASLRHGWRFSAAADGRVFSAAVFRFGSREYLAEQIVWVLADEVIWAADSKLK